MVLNDIIEQAAGRQSGGSDHGGKQSYLMVPKPSPLSNVNLTHHRNALFSSDAQFSVLHPGTQGKVALSPLQH